MNQSKPTDGDSSPLTDADFMRLLMQHEPALRAFARSLLSDSFRTLLILNETSDSVKANRIVFPSAMTHTARVPRTSYAGAGRSIPAAIV